MTQHKVGPRAIALMHAFEGCKLKAYRCPAGVWTIGWGDTGLHVKAGLVWTQAQADAAFKARIEREFIPGVAKAIGEKTTTPAQFGALTSFAYNVGVSAMASSTLIKKHRAGDHDGAAEQFGKWTRGGGRVLPGLVRRRKAERLLYEGRLAELDGMIGLKA